MKIKHLNDQLSVSEQITPHDLEELKHLGVKTIICNRPDGEAPEQTPFETIRSAASLLRMTAVSIPFKGDGLSADDVNQLANMLKSNGRIHMYCRSGARSSTLWAMAGMALGYQETSVLDAVKEAGYKLDSDKLHRLLALQNASLSGSNQQAESENHIDSYDVVIVGGGSGGLSLAASLRKRDKRIRIAVIEPSDITYYQPGWTMVGGGVFDARSTKKQTKDFIPSSVNWIKNSVVGFSPDRHLVHLSNDTMIQYQQLVVAPGLELNWAGIEGLVDTLGSNGVTSNYRYDLAPYTWQLVQETKSGKALFTQPPMPIKCAGAPQKAMYLSSDYWFKNGLLDDIGVQFFTAGEVIFGVQDYVPALNSYLKKYQIQVNYKHTLFKVDGNSQTAYFKTLDGAGEEQIVESSFDMLHVCPPQRAPKFVRDSVLADEAGWLDVDQATLMHKRYGNVWGVGDVINAPNAKTLAAVRKQVPVVALNVLGALQGEHPSVGYSGYGSCPLTVERGKIVLAEFVYGGKHSPTFPNWLNDGTQPTRFGWFLKARILPAVYWRMMLNGIEWFTKPKSVK